MNEKYAFLLKNDDECLQTKADRIKILLTG